MVPDSRYDRLPGYVDETTVPRIFFSLEERFQNQQTEPPTYHKKKNTRNTKHLWKYEILPNC